MQYCLLGKKLFVRVKVLYSKYVESFILIGLVLGNILFGGNGITNKEYVPFFSWDLFSYIDPLKQEYFIVLPEQGGTPLIDLSVGAVAKIELRYAVQQCAKKKFKAPLPNTCGTVIRDNIEKSGSTYGVVMVTEQQHPYFIKCKSLNNCSTKKIQSHPYSKIDIKKI